MRMQISYQDIRYITSTLSVDSRHEPPDDSGHAHLCRVPRNFEGNGDNIGHNPVQ